jgi:hypothetical protein
MPCGLRKVGCMCMWGKYVASLGVRERESWLGCCHRKKESKTSVGHLSLK